MTADRPRGTGSTALHLVVPSAVASVPRTRRAVTTWLRTSVPTATDADRAALGLAVTEVVANAVEHAGAGEVTVTVTHADGAVRARVRDRGAGSERASASGTGWGTGQPPPDAERGRGMLLIAAAVDELEVERTEPGTTVSFVRHVGAPPGRR